LYCHDRIAFACVVLGAVLGLAACGPRGDLSPVSRPPEQADAPESPHPLPAPDPTPDRSVVVAFPGTPDTSGLDDAQIDAMFDAAVALARPGESKRAICVGMQGLADGAVKDAPEATIRRLAELLRLPAFPAAQCRADVYPFVTATKAEAILYTASPQGLCARQRFGGHNENTGYATSLRRAMGSLRVRNSPGESRFALCHR
jgi:hypothetical protein